MTEWLLAFGYGASSVAARAACVFCAAAAMNDRRTAEDALDGFLASGLFAACCFVWAWWPR